MKAAAPNYNPAGSSLTIASPASRAATMGWVIVRFYVAVAIETRPILIAAFAPRGVTCA